ncbi:hypothetical protein QBC35DRAFT_396257, partial [Podospora australis]
MAQTVPQDDIFMEEVRALRAAYEKKRNSTNLVPPTGRPVLDCGIDVVDGIAYHTYWYERTSDTVASDYSQDEEMCQVIRLADIAGTLSGDILRLERNLPPLEPDCDYTIIRDDVLPLVNPPPLPRFEDDSEDISVALASLSVIEVKPDEHFIKKGKYAS